MPKQFFTTCKFCGKQILMTMNLENGTWVACNPELLRYRLTENGYGRYVTPEGSVVRGERDRDGLFGYKKHERCILP